MDFARQPHALQIGLAIFTTRLTTSRTCSFSKFNVRGSSRIAPITPIRSPGHRAATTDRNCFEGSYAVTSTPDRDTTTCPPRRIRGKRSTRPSTRMVWRGYITG